MAGSDVPQNHGNTTTHDPPPHGSREYHDPPPPSGPRAYHDPPLYMGKKGSICHFPRALPASIWRHCSQVPAFTRMLGKQKGCDNDTFCAVFPASGYFGTPKHCKARENTKWLRGLSTIYRVLYQAQGWCKTLFSGGKHCPLWGVGAFWQLGVSVVEVCAQIRAPTRVIKRHYRSTGNFCILNIENNF